MAIPREDATAVRRLAVIAYHCSPLTEPGAGDAGGMTVYVRALAEALARRGINTDVFTRATSDIGRMVAVADGVRVISIEAGPSKVLDKDRLLPYLDDFVAGVGAFGTGQRVRYDLAHSHYWQSGLAGMKLVRRWGIPLVHSHHTLGRVKNQWMAPGDEPEPQVRIDGETRVTSSADLLVASTDEEYEHLACLYGADHDRLRTLHPGVDHALFSPGVSPVRRQLGIPTNAAVLVTAGRIQPLKGLDLALHTIGELRRSIDRPVFLLIVGGASGRAGEAEVKRLHELASTLGIEPNIRWLGPQPHRSLPNFYRAADAVLICSHSESFGLTALEAQACGKPVVGTTVGGLSHVVEDGGSGWLIDDRDPKRFARCLTELLASDEIQRKFSKRAEARSARFSWDAAADQFLELYVCLVREEFPEVCTC